MQKRVSEDIARCEKALVEKLQPVFSQKKSAPNGDSDCWFALGSFLEWQLFPSILQLAPAWPHHLVWCDGVEFFYRHIKQPNFLHALGCSWWLPCDQSLPNDAETGGIAHAELIEVEMHLLEDETMPRVDYCIKIWANNLCHFLTPTKISVTPSCSDVASTPNFSCLFKTIKKTTRVSNRRSITSLLGGLGSKGRTLLEELLNDTDVVIRRAAVDGLARQKLTSDFAIPLIAKALQDTDLEVQHLTANVLWRRVQTNSAFLPLLHQATPVLLQIFGHEPEIHRHFYINEIFTFLGQSEPSVVAAMVDFLADETLRLRTTKILWNINLPTTEMLEIYQTALESDDIRWRVAAAFSLWFFDIDGGKAFIDATEDDKILQEPLDLAMLLAYEYNSSLRLMPSKTVVPVLTSILQRRKTAARLWCEAALALAKTYPRKMDDASQQLLQSLAPELIQYLKYDNEVVQRYAIKALGAIGENANVAIPVLIDMVYDQKADDYLRGEAAEALINIKPTAKLVVSLFNFLCRQESYALHSNALPMLKLLDIQEVLALLKDLLFNGAEEIDLTYEIFDILAEMGSDAIPLLVELTKHEYWQMLAISALGKTHDSAAIPYLLNCLHNADYKSRKYAAQALGELGTLATDAIPALAEAINDSDLAVCARAVEALGKIGKEALPILLAAIDSTDDFTLGWIAKTLEEFDNKEAKTALKKLVTLTASTANQAR